MAPADIAAGSVWAFLGAIFLVLIWLATGPLFGFTEAWQLVINTGTTIVTFLMVFRHPTHTESRDAGDPAEARRADRVPRDRVEPVRAHRGRHR
jgi:hypothetical protein